MREDSRLGLLFSVLSLPLTPRSTTVPLVPNQDLKDEGRGLVQPLYRPTTDGVRLLFPPLPGRNTRRSLSTVKFGQSRVPPPRSGGASPRELKEFNSQQRHFSVVPLVDCWTDSDSLWATRRRMSVDIESLTPARPLPSSPRPDRSKGGTGPSTRARDGTDDDGRRRQSTVGFNM